MAVFALMAPTVCLAAVLLAAVCHEMGHYIALRLCGGRLEGLSVSAFGAQMRIRDRNRLSYGREALCVLAGPLVNVTLSWLMSMGGKWRVQPAAADGAGRRAAAVDRDSLGDGSLFGGQGVPSGNAGAPDGAGGAGDHPVAAASGGLSPAGNGGSRVLHRAGICSCQSGRNRVE